MKRQMQLGAGFGHILAPKLCTVRKNENILQLSVLFDNMVVFSGAAQPPRQLRGLNLQYELIRGGGMASAKAPTVLKLEFHFVSLAGVNHQVAKTLSRLRLTYKQRTEIDKESSLRKVKKKDMT